MQKIKRYQTLKTIQYQMALNLFIGMTIVFFLFLCYLSTPAADTDIGWGGTWISLILLLCLGVIVWIGTRPIWVVLSPQGAAYKGLFRAKQTFLWSEILEVAVFSEGDELTPYLCLSKKAIYDWEEKTVASLYASDDIILIKYSEEAVETIAEFYVGTIRKITH